MSNPAPPRHVGNPIDVISGNNYHSTTDFDAFGSPLSFSRHYNSALASHNLRLGQGWRHSYSVVLSEANADTLRVVQSDGRVILFHREDDTTDPTADSANTEFSHGSPESAPAWNVRYSAIKASDGYIVSTTQGHLWQLPDGRQLEFRGSFLVRISWPNDMQLTLRYQDQRLVSVRDSWGRTLRLRYTPGELALRQYDPTQDLELSGHLSELELPDGSVIRYRYDGRRNLTQAQYQDGRADGFVYGSAHFPHHMTGYLSGNTDVRSWQYDQYGRVASYQAGSSGHGLGLMYDDSVAVHDTGSGTTTVLWDSGREAVYRWRHSGVDAHQVTTVRERLCASCNWITVDYDRVEATFRANTPSIGVHEEMGVHEQIERPRDADAPGAPDRSETPSAAGALLEFTPEVEGLGGSLLLRDPERPGTERQFELLADRHGQLLDIVSQADEATNPSSPAPPTAPASAVSLRQSCRELSVVTSGPTESGDSLFALLGNSCLEQLQSMDQISRELDGGVIMRRTSPSTGTTNSTTGTSSVSPSGTTPATSPSSAPPPPSPFCFLPAGRSCAQLFRDYQMAQLSDCAYADSGDCGRDWESVNPQDIGLSPRLFVGNQFHARLFRNRHTGEYVVAFRGTDQLRDLDDSLTQYDGLRGNQYDRAFELDRQLQLRLPNAQLHYTGHSLGGGLASIAALRSGTNATVFNAAGLSRDGVSAYNLNINDAPMIIDALHVDGDILSAHQDRPAPTGPFIGSSEFDPHNTNSNLALSPAAGTRFTLTRPERGFLDYQESMAHGLTAPLQRIDGVILHRTSAILYSIRRTLNHACGIYP